MRKVIVVLMLACLSAVFCGSVLADSKPIMPELRVMNFGSTSLR